MPESPTTEGATTEPVGVLASAAPNAPTASSGLFGPVIISIPKRGAQSSTDGTSPNPLLSKTRRPRVILSDDLAVLVQSKPPGDATCNVSTSRDRVTIHSGGGTIGILVGVGDGEVLSTLKARSNSPRNVQVSRQPNIAGDDSHAYFLIRSRSHKTANFTVKFESPCGSADVVVTVIRPVK
ncbi:MAG: hypothetical protein WBD22_09745 [Pyrinomonadaceae bacterium]